MKTKWCPECLKPIIVKNGKFNRHIAKGGHDCPGSGLPTSKALRVTAKVVGGGLPGLGKGNG